MYGSVVCGVFTSHYSVRQIVRKGCSCASLYLKKYWSHSSSFYTERRVKSAVQSAGIMCKKSFKKVLSVLGPRHMPVYTYPPTAPIIPQTVTSTSHVLQYSPQEQQKQQAVSSSHRTATAQSRHRASVWGTHVTLGSHPVCLTPTPQTVWTTLLDLFLADTVTVLRCVIDLRYVVSERTTFTITLCASYTEGWLYGTVMPFKACTQFRLPYGLVSMKDADKMFFFTLGFRFRILY